jgi:hypothetical protein
MRSAFESWPASSPRSLASHSSSAGYEDDEATKRVRVVGFPESSDFKFQSNELSRFASCTLDERPKRQSSLAQQLALDAFEQEQKPKLRAINTKAKGLNFRSRRASTPPAGVGAGTAASATNHNVPVQSGHHSDDGNNRISFEFPSTLPSGQGSASFMTTHHHQLHRGNSSGSEAMAIPQGLTKAYTAPQPLPELSELSPSLVAIIEGSNSSKGAGKTSASSTTTPTAKGGKARRTNAATTAASRLLPSPASNQHSPPHASTSASSLAAAAATPYNYSPQAAAEKGALAQVAGLKEALRQQQEEVARLQLELAKLAMQQQMSRQRSGSADFQMTPVTPDAGDEHHGSGGSGLGSRDHHHGPKSMSPDDCIDSPFEGFAATVAPPAHPWENRGGRAW